MTLTRRSTTRSFPSRSTDVEILQYFQSINGISKTLPVPRFPTRLKSAIINTKAFTLRELASTSKI